MDKLISDKTKFVETKDIARFVTHTDDFNPELPFLFGKYIVKSLQQWRPHVKFPLPPHRKGVHDFLFITKGKAIRKPGMDSYELTPYTFCFNPAHQIMTHEDMTLDTEGYYGHFNIEIFKNEFFQKNCLSQFSFLHLRGNPVITITQKSAELILPTLARLEHEYDTGAKSGMNIITSLFLTLFIEIQNHQPNLNITNQNRPLVITQRYKQALSEHIYEYQKVSDYAKILSISPSYLNRCVKNTLGRKAQELLFEMRLIEAKVLLKQTDLTINEIAFKMGKKNPSDFIRFFKTATGMTPNQYRKS